MSILTLGERIVIDEVMIQGEFDGKLILAIMDVLGVNVGCMLLDKGTRKWLIDRLLETNPQT
jgi:hypothetical protein